MLCLTVSADYNQFLEPIATSTKWMAISKDFLNLCQQVQENSQWGVELQV